MTSVPLVSMLFVPASDQDKLSKVSRLPGRAVILDLEDSVAVSAKPEARLNAAEVLNGHSGAKEMWVRVNGFDTGLLEDDLASVIRPGLDGIDLPKVESADQLASVSSMIDQLERSMSMKPGSVRLMATVETARGVGEVDAIASIADPRLQCLGFGTGDFCLDIGISTDPDSPTVIAAKVAVVLASRRAGILPPHDSVYINFKDPDGLRADTIRGKRMGFFGKHAIHPDQIGVIEDVYLPTSRELERARRLVSSFEAAEADGRAAIAFEGELVDYPLAERYRQVVALGEFAGGRDDA